MCERYSQSVSGRRIRELGMTSRLTRLMTDHPSSVNETYLEHMAFAARFGFILLAASGAALVHAILPFLFEKTASQLVAALHEKTVNRGL